MRHPIAFYIMVLLWNFFSSTTTAKDQYFIADSSYSFSSSYSPSQLDLPLDDIKFSFNPGRYFSFGITTNEFCYIILKISGGQSIKNHRLSIDNTSLDTVMIYALQGSSQQLLYSGGNKIPYDPNRDYVWHTISLNINPEPHFYLIATKAIAKNVNVEYNILPQRELQQLYTSFNNIIFFYLGVIAIIVFTLIGFYAFFRRNELILYTGYILACTAWVLAHYGYLFPIVYPSFPLLNDIIKPVSSLLASFFFLCLIRRLFKFIPKVKYFNRFISAFTALNVLFILGACTHLIWPFRWNVFKLFNISWHVFLFLSICIIIVLLALIINTNRITRVFSFGVSLTLIFAGLQIFSSTGHIHSRFLNDHGLLIAFFVEIILLTYGIGYHIWKEEREKDVQLTLLEETQKQTLQQLITIQDSEQKRIAEELHDSIGPMLAAIKINFLRAVRILGGPLKTRDSSLNHLVASTENIIDDSITEIRNISHKLMPKGLSSKGLISLLSEYFENLQEAYHLDIQFTHAITLTLNQEIQLNLYRMMSELALNAAKHSNGSNIQISIITQDQGIYIDIQDNGTGFLTSPNGTSLGLKNIESRVLYLKGTLDIQSKPGEGLSVKVSIPCPSV